LGVGTINNRYGGEAAYDQDLGGVLVGREKTFHCHAVHVFASPEEDVRHLLEASSSKPLKLRNMFRYLPEPWDEFSTYLCQFRACAVDLQRSFLAATAKTATSDGVLPAIISMPPGVPTSARSHIYQKWLTVQSMDRSSGDGAKLRSWLEQVVRIPGLSSVHISACGNDREAAVSPETFTSVTLATHPRDACAAFLARARAELDRDLFGQTAAKQSVME
jgi:hypothetical protein